MPTLIHPLTRSQVDAIRRNSSGSYIFHGASGMGKATLAYELARQVNCLGDENGLCIRCRQFEGGSYPDLITVQSEDKPSILIEQVRGLVQALSLSLYYASGTRLVIIDGAHLLTTEAQNALLKLIEEPPASTMFILVTDQIEALLPTVRSRCAAIYFSQIDEGQIAAFLERDHHLKPSDAGIIAAASDGVPGLAVTLATQPEVAQSRLELRALAVTALRSRLFERLVLAKRLTDTKADLLRFGYALHAHIVGQLRSGDEVADGAARQMVALERFRRQLAAKVSPRVALERLMLEL